MRHSPIIVFGLMEGLLFPPRYLQLPLQLRLPSHQPRKKWILISKWMLFLPKFLVMIMMSTIIECAKKIVAAKILALRVCSVMKSTRYLAMLSRQPVIIAARNRMGYRKLQDHRRMTTLTTFKRPLVATRLKTQSECVRTEVAVMPKEALRIGVRSNMGFILSISQVSAGTVATHPRLLNSISQLGENLLLKRNLLVQKKPSSRK